MQKSSKASRDAAQPLSGAFPLAMHEQRRRVVTRVTEPTLTKQQFKNECDVNNIVKTFETTGAITHLNNFEGSFGDFTQAPADYHEAVQTVMEAQDLFDALPSKVRAHFENDPAKFLAFQDDPEAIALMEEHGLKKPSEVIEDEPPAPESKKSQNQTQPEQEAKAD